MTVPAMLLANSTNDSWPIIPPPTSSTATPLISHEMKESLENVFSALAFSFGVVGVITNAINIRVFIRQGVFSDSNTISLFCLAVADLLGCLSAIPAALCQVIRYVGVLPVFYSCYFVTSLVASVLHIIMARLTCWITVYISVERSLCVLIPFKVKALLQPKVTATSMIVLYAVVLGSYIPYYSSARIIMTVDGRLNATIARLAEGKLGRESAYYLSFIYNNILTNVAFGIVIITTGLMVYKLKLSRRWRQAATGGATSASSKDGAKATNNSIAADASERKEHVQGKRELEVMKMVTLVTGLFLVCLSMNLIPGFATALVEGATFSGVNANLFYLAYYYKIVFDLINSSLNFFFYIKVSSRYKQAFTQVFRKTPHK